MSQNVALFNMIEQQIRPWNVLRSEVLETLSCVPRASFIPPHLRALAYSDTDVPLNENGAAVLSPKLEARLFHDLQLTGSENVLEIGTGSGYSSALIARHARQVVSIEIDEELAKTAKTTLKGLGVENVKVITGDGSNPATAQAYGPFDAIVLSGSVGEFPEQLLPLLSEQGRLLCICGTEPIMSAMIVYRAQADAKPKALWDMNAPRLVNFADVPAFQF